VSLTLVRGGKPRPVSGVEIKALVAERMAELKIRRAEEQEKRDAERNYSERLEFYGKPSRRIRFWRGVVYVGGIGTAAGLTALATNQAQATLALILAFGCGLTALVISLREGE
jgi:hypothetical protein